MTGYAGLLGCCGQQQQARDALGEGFYKTREHGFPGTVAVQVMGFIHHDNIPMG